MKVRELIEQLEGLEGPGGCLDRDVVVEHYDDYGDINVYRVRLQSDGTVLIDTTIGSENLPA